VSEQSEQVAGLLVLANQLLQSGDAGGALKAANRALNLSPRPVPPGVFFARAQALMRVSTSPLMVLHALEAELVIDPGNELAQRQLADLLKVPGVAFASPPQRTFNTSLTEPWFKILEAASQRYTYRGVPMIKNCFDLALYPLLLDRVRPKTIIEIGTFYGGSALWFADLSRNFGFETHIHTLDITRMHVLEDPRVTFIRGSGRELEKSFSPSLLAQLPRPLLVVEDADHECPTTQAVLSFFHPILRDGEYIIVEDTMSAAGARKALADFLAAHATDYEIDASYCDYFGYNMTWCLNGFLRRRIRVSDIAAATAPT